MELVGVVIPKGDTDEILDDIVLEYLAIGWNPRQILTLFRSPLYGATHQIYLLKGEAYVGERVRQLASQWSQGWINGGEHDAERL